MKEKYLDTILVVWVVLLLGYFTASLPWGWWHSKPDSAKFDKLPVELADCRAFSVENTGKQWVVIMRCPNSVTATTSGSHTFVITEGK